ncbi:preprotein translocase subunit SecE, partial [Slackia exigua]
AKKAEKASAKPKKQRFKFLKDVRLELKRVTWPTRQEVIRWTGVVLGALVFFGVFVAVLDAVIQPIVVAISGLGA